MITTKKCRGILWYENKLGHFAFEAFRNTEAVFGKGIAEIRTIQR